MYHPRGDDSAHTTVVLALERAAVNAALIGRILLVRCDPDAVERTEILFAVMILTILHAAMNTAVYIIVVKHHFTSKVIIGFPTIILSANSQEVYTKSAFLNMI